MKRFQIAILAGTVAVASPAPANHPGNTGIPFASRGACEAANNALSSEDSHWLPVMFPEVFDSSGDAASFLRKAFTCELDGDDWYITDHRIEVLESEWFLRK
jgi:hypothetical protein